MSTQISSYLDDSFDFLYLQKKTEEELDFMPDMDTDSEEEGQELCFEFTIESLKIDTCGRDLNKKNTLYYKEEVAVHEIKGKRLNF